MLCLPVGGNSWKHWQGVTNIVCLSFNLNYVTVIFQQSVYCLLCLKALNQFVKERQRSSSITIKFDYIISYYISSRAMSWYLNCLDLIIAWPTNLLCHFIFWSSFVLIESRLVSLHSFVSTIFSISIFLIIPWKILYWYRGVKVVSRFALVNHFIAKSLKPCIFCTPRRIFTLWGSN